MANTLTELYAVNYNVHGVGPQWLKELQIGDVDTDIVLHTVMDDRHQQLSSWLFAEATSATFKFKSRSQALTGTVSTTNGSPTLTGVGTKFQSELAVGQEVVVTDGDTRTILSITSDLIATFSSNAATSVSGKTYKRQKFINRSVELAANQGMAKGFDTELLPLVSARGESLVMQSSAIVTSMTIGICLPAQMKIGNKT